MNANTRFMIKPNGLSHTATTTAITSATKR
jgi:hypothetical protein